MATQGGVCRIDSVEIAEVSFKARGNIPGAGVQAVFILTDSKTGERFGSGTFNAWSDETTTKLNAVLASMEADIASMVFKTDTTNGVRSDPKHLEDEVPGL